jgi:hypothetical protein
LVEKRDFASFHRLQFSASANDNTWLSTPAAAVWGEMVNLQFNE